MKKRLLALMLTLAICVTFMPTVFFQSVEEVNAVEYYEHDITFQAGAHGEFVESPYYDDWSEPSPEDYYYVIQNNKKMAHTWIENDTPNFLYKVPGLPSMPDGVYAFFKEMADFEPGTGLFEDDSVERAWIELMVDLFPTLEGHVPNVLVIPDKGWVFDGWYNAAEGGDLVNFTDTYDEDVTFYAHYIEEKNAPAHKKTDWKYITADLSKFLLDELLGIITEQGRTYSDKEWKSFCNSNSMLDTAYALCGDCGLEERVRLNTPNVKWNGNAYNTYDEVKENLVEYSDGWNKTNSVDELDLYYFDVSAFEQYFDEIWTAMKYMGISEQAIQDTYIDDGEGGNLYEDVFEDFAKMLKTYNVEFGFDKPTRVAPRDPGRYIAMLVPANYKKALTVLPFDGVFSFPIYAASLFTIESTDNSCEHEWEYSGLSGTAGPVLAEYVKTLVHNRMIGNYTPTPELNIPDVVKYAVEEFVSQVLLHSQDEDFDETFSYDSYDDLTAPLNDLFSKITAKCSDCGKKQYIEVKGADENKAEKGVTFDKSHWTASELKDEYVTYYVSVDKFVDAIGSLYNFFENPEGMSDVDDVEYEMIKEIYKALSGVLGSAKTTAPIKEGKYVAITTFKGEYGEPLDLSKLTDILNILSEMYGHGSVDPTELDPVTMRKLYNTYKTVDGTLEDLLDFAVTFYSVRPETVIDAGKSYEKHIQPAVEYVDSKVKNTLSKNDAAYVEIAREKIDEANENAKKMRLTEEEKTALKAANDKVQLAEKKLVVMNSRTSITKLTAGKRKITVKWNALGNDVAGYKLYRSTKKYGTYKCVNTTTLTKKTNKSLKKGKKYYYKVCGYAKIGGQLVYTNYSTAKAKKAK